MIEWSDRGIVLAARPHGESGAVIHVLCQEQGRFAGMLHGAQSSRRRGLSEPGTMVQAHWQARLADHLGNWQLESTRQFAAELLDEPLRLAGLQAVCSLAQEALPEREPHEDVFFATEALLNTFDGEFWAPVLIKWETKLLESLGFGLDLTKCAATGSTENLCFVSPKSGRAVSAEGAGPYKERLLPLPGFLIGQGDASPERVVEGLRLTAHFLQKHVFDVTNRPLPVARIRFQDSYSRFAGTSGTVDAPDD